MPPEIDKFSSQGLLNQSSGPVNQHFGDDITAIEGGVVVNRSPGATIQIIQSLVKSAPPFTYRPRLQRMIEDYTAVFGGRDAELANLDAWLNDPNQPWGLLLAPTGRGKTALLIHWVLRLHEQGHVRAAFHSISLRYETATTDATFRTLAHTLAGWHNESPPEANTSPDHLRVIVADYLRQPLPDGRPAVVLLDGLDEAINWQVGRDLFPRQLPPGLKVLASARQLAHGDQATWLERLGWERRETRAFTLGGLEQATVASILQAMGDPLAQLATDVDVVGELYRVSEGDPLTIRLLVEALQNEELTPEQLTRQPPGLAEYLESWLRSLEEAAVDSPAVYSLLNACATALGPLTTDDLAALAPNELDTGLRLRQAVGTVERFIIGDGRPGSGYVFSYPRLREAFVERLLPDEYRAWQERFVTYGRRVFANLRNRPDLKSLPYYVCQFWPRHLADYGAWEELEQVLNTTTQRRDRPINLWAELHHIAEGSYAGYLVDLDLLWQHADSLFFGAIEDQGKGIALQLRCALIASSIHSLAGNFSPQLLVQLVMVGIPEGKWHTAAVLEYTRQKTFGVEQAQVLTGLAPHLPTDQLLVALEIARFIKDEFYRVEALTGLAPHLSPELRTQVLTDALETTRAIKDEVFRAKALTYLAPLLPPELLPVVKETALTIQKVADRANALTHLVPFLPPELRAEVLAEALAAARATKNDELYKPYVHVEALAGLTIHLPPELRVEVLAEALASAQAIELESHRAHALISLAIHLPPEELRNQVLTAALEAARAIELETNRAEALTNLAPLLPTELQTQVLVDAIAAIQAINDANEVHRAKALIRLAPLLPPELLLFALEIACVIKDEAYRAEALTGLAPHLPPELRTHIVAEAMEATRAILGKNARIYHLPRLAANLPPELGIQVLADALEAARVIKDEFARVEILACLFPQMPLELRTEMLAYILEGTRNIKNDLVDPNFRARVLTSLAGHLAQNLRNEVVNDALEAAYAIMDGQSRAKALTNLVVYLSSEVRGHVLAESLKIAYDIWDRHSRARALTDLVPHLPSKIRSNVLADALETARTIKSGHERVRALVGLVSYLPLDQQAEVLAEVLEAIRTIRVEVRSPELIGIPLESLSQMVTDASEAIRVEVLTDLIVDLPLELRAEVLAYAQQAAHAIKEGHKRAKALAGLVDYLSSEVRDQMLDDAFSASRALKKIEHLSPYNYVKSFTGLATYLPLELQSELLSDALAATLVIQEVAYRSIAWKTLVPHLVTWTQAVPLEGFRLWRSTLPTLACGHRQTLLGNLQMLLPWIKTLDGDRVFKELPRIIKDVGQWWP
ncbi:MAG: hypothetical protein MN733_14990 [Nitrososphaera sp.]|nr:hypothetical protein [Nitrososphaera sp.]